MVRNGSRLPDIPFVSIHTEQPGCELMYHRDRQMLLFRMSVGHSPTRELPKFSTRQLVSPHQPAADVTMHLGSRHDVIRCSCVALERPSRAWAERVGSELSPRS